MGSAKAKGTIQFETSWHEHTSTQQPQCEKQPGHRKSTIPHSYHIGIPWCSSFTASNFTEAHNAKTPVHKSPRKQPLRSRSILQSNHRQVLRAVRPINAARRNRCASQATLPFNKCWDIFAKFYSATSNILIPLKSHLRATDSPRKATTGLQNTKKNNSTPTHTYRNVSLTQQFLWRFVWAKSPRVERNNSASQRIPSRSSSNVQSNHGQKHERRNCSKWPGRLSSSARFVRM